VNLRNATYSDLPRILEIEELSFSQPWSLNSFRRELTLPFSRLIVASCDTADNLPCGFLCRWLVADELHILNIAVHPAHRHTGIGTRLIEETIGEAKAKHTQVITLEVRRANLSARSLYRKFNFQERRLRKNYYAPGEDAIVMELPIVPVAIVTSKRRFV
jgi:[ribosomal protein S18]-alanine N-acetyltransferase